MRLRNPRYISYYRAVMNHRAKTDPKQAIGGKWETMGIHQLTFIKKQGMMPCHTLLDIGCGSLRGGLHYIQYLDEGHYTGMDISAELLEAGRIHLDEKKLTSKEPLLVLTDDMLFSEFNDVQFDYLNAQSVLSHMPKEDIEQMFENLHKVMHKNSVFIATYKELMDGESGYHSSVNELNFHYTLEDLQKIATKHYFNAEKISDDTMERTQSILKITKST